MLSQAESKPVLSDVEGASTWSGDSEQSHAESLTHDRVSKTWCANDVVTFNTGDTGMVSWLK